MSLHYLLDGYNVLHCLALKELEKLEDQRLGTERTSGAVDGVIRGAEVVRSYPVGDSYVTELQLDIRKMDQLRNYGEVQAVPEKRQQTLF